MDSPESCPVTIGLWPSQASLVSWPNRWKKEVRPIRLTLLLLVWHCGVWCAFISSASGQTTSSVSLGWTASTDPAVVGYNLYSGVSSQTYTNSASVGNVTNVTVAGLVAGTTYYFNITAVDSFGDESPFCNEVSYTASTNSTNNTSSSTNTAPTISGIANQSINANSSSGPLAFTIGDLETPNALTLSAASSNPTLVPNANIVLNGSGTNWSVTITPIAGQTGTVTIAVTVCDPSLCTTTSFQLTVNPLPVVVLTAPAGGTSYTAPAAISLSANVTPNGHTITAVQFFNGASLIGTATAAPYGFNWTAVAAGSYALAARASFDAGSSVSSGVTSITVAPGATLPAPWQTLDIGTVNVNGSASVSNGVYAVTGAGNIGSSADSFRFLYQGLSGDALTSSVSSNVTVVP